MLNKCRTKIVLFVVCYFWGVNVNGSHDYICAWIV